MSLHSSQSSSSSTDGSAFPWILEHLLTYPGNYEIPLRTMYTLNSAPQAQTYSRQPGTPVLSDGSSLESSPSSTHFLADQPTPSTTPNATEHFKSCLMSHMSQLPSQPFSLPPAFITSFVRRCFTEDLCLVDFTQSLTALDYLKDLETRRKRELTAVLQRLGVDRKSMDEDKNGLQGHGPGVAQWVSGIQEKEKKVEAIYTHVYLGLRRWTLINEMRLEPFSKANSLAMLNTLYPPTTVILPTRQVTSAILASQRDAFFRYIQGVEKNGKGILKNLEQQGKRPNDMNGWAVVRDLVDRYLRMANGVIEDCLEVTGPEFFTTPDAASRRLERRADSGVSFAVGDRPSTSSSAGSLHKPAAPSSSMNKPLPPSPERVPPRSMTTPPTPKKARSTLERIARGFGNLRSRNEGKETAGNEIPEKSRSLKKMKSASSIGGLRAKHARAASDEQPFEIDDAKRQRLIMEARREKENRLPNGKTRSFEV